MEHQQVGQGARPEDSRLAPLHPGLAVRLEAQGDRPRRPEGPPVAPESARIGKDTGSRPIAAGSLLNFFAMTSGVPSPSRSPAGGG